MHLAHACSCALGNDPLGTLEGGVFLVYLNFHYFLKIDSAPWS